MKKDSIMELAAAFNAELDNLEKRLLNYQGSFSDEMMPTEEENEPESIALAAQVIFNVARKVELHEVSARAESLQDKALARAAEENERWDDFYLSQSQGEA